MTRDVLYLHNYDITLMMTKSKHSPLELQVTSFVY